MEEYLNNLFSAKGVMVPLTLEEWTGGWVTIVGGINGKPTAQQFNKVFYVLSALAKSNAEDISQVRQTANGALPESKFTAAEIIALLKAYGLMVGVNADMVDGKHADALQQRATSTVHPRSRMDRFPWQMAAREPPMRRMHERTLERPQRPIAIRHPISHPEPCRLPGAVPGHPLLRERAATSEQCRPAEERLRERSVLAVRHTTSIPPA